MNEELDTLKIAAWILIVIGCIETILFVHAINTGTSFSGGAFLYVIAGIFLLKKNKTVYKYTLFTFTSIFVFIPAAIIFLTLVIAQLYTAADIPITWQVPIEDTLEGLAYLALLTTLVALLHHPNTRTAYGLESYRGTVWTMHMPRFRFFTVMASSVVIAGLLIGPHIMHNPYKLITEELRTDGEIKSKVGVVERLELLDTSENNWNIVSHWKVTGNNGQGKYRTVLGPNKSLSVRTD